jgi:hypothetical protein
VAQRETSQPSFLTVTPDQAVRRRVAYLLVVMALICVVAAVGSIASRPEYTASQVAFLALSLGCTALFVWVARAYFRPARFRVEVGPEHLRITEMHGRSHSWERAEIGTVHHYERREGKARVPCLLVRDPLGAVLVDVRVDVGVDIEALADATAAVGIYTTRQPHVAVGVTSHSPAGRPDIVAVTPAWRRFVLRLVVLALVPLAVAAGALAILLARDLEDAAVAVLLVGFLSPVPGLAYSLRRATGLTFSAAGVHPGAGVSLSAPIPIEHIRQIVVDESWLGTVVALDLHGGRRWTFERQVGLRADDVRLAALVVGIPTS